VELILRDVQLGDVGAYIRMRCDPVMMAELGGPLPREGMERKVRSDVESVAADTAWVKMIVADGVVAGTVSLWTDAEAFSETGWMVLPEHQGRGYGKWAVRTLLEQARDAGRWGLVHAFPGVTNAASNGICRSVGFTLVEERDVRFADRVLRSNHWVIDPQKLPTR
jgi:RimJ/RimL family protein N-acetyltransferase